ncbi:hypothetical protein RVR_6270 [Actinacidiphila reveromycinica]|uniref:Secreted protein n=1 Tax=Actinacidiphila reveromycinica TaxID=659352 RepID=A0A7U3UVK1_9ACTN|nr:hypothetical protein [Streptomyces sp. SN-593]BBA99584.1 hypothetical protein RVR_6270 [Streptomyces sp. SN-593]
MVRISSGVAAAGFLATAIAVVGALTAAAADAPPRRHMGGVHGAAADGATPSATGSGTSAAASTALPAGTGHGSRVVYSLGRHRVWLVDAHDGVLRSYGVRGGTAAPARGTHRVFARESGRVVLFASTDGVNVGFAPEGGAGARGAAIREAPADADALWRHAPVGSLVAVVP